MNTTTYNRSKCQKFLIVYHLIFVTRYRLKLSHKSLKSVKELIRECCETHGWKITALEFDNDKPDHWRLLVSASPDIAPLLIAKTIKQYVSYSVWNTKPIQEIQNLYRTRHQVFSEGSFICTIGCASKDTIEEYIRNQG